MKKSVLLDRIDDINQAHQIALAMNGVWDSYRALQNEVEKQLFGKKE